ncbi:hypothetical protein ACFW1J_01440 [Priestia aryabhattai]|uniref:hypothetical protein n=1 Tax=Priestia aryabhattai TaxID=412384 RepID=UPI00366F2ADD
MSTLVPIENYNEIAVEYEKIPQDTLVVYTAHQLVTEGYPLIYENIVALAFTFFPKRFCLRGYSQFPDSTVINKSWLRCRTDKKWLIGSAKSGFVLTDLGRSEAIKIAENWEGSKRIKGKKREVDYRAEATIKELRKREAFNSWMRNGGTIVFHVSELLLALHCTMGSSTDVKKQRLTQMKSYAEAMGDEEVLVFLEACEITFNDTFNPLASSRYKGGMNKRKGK